MPHARIHRIQRLLSELRRRRVFRVTGVYVVGAFAVLQGADILAPALHLPGWTMTFLVVVALVGFPVTVGLAWAFDIVPGGIERTRSTSDDVDGPRSGGRHPAEADPGRARGLSPDAPPDGAPSKPSVAVIPFLNLSPDPDNEYFADGITEDVIAHLSKIGSLNVISRTSVMPFKKRGQSLREIGEALGATTLLDGSVRRVGDRVRIVAQLVDARTDQHLWAETYDRELVDIFSIQTDVAFQMAAALRAELSPEEQTRISREPTSNLEAYQLYLKGRHWMIRYTPDALQRSIEFFERAVAQDPAYALAYASIAMAYAELGETGALPPDVARRHATEAAAEALRLDSSLAEAHCADAHLKSIWELDWDGAEASFRRAIELCPSNADTYDLFGRMCSALGRYEEALAMQRKAQELDPLVHRLDVATTLLRAGRYDEAVEEAERAVEFDPDQDRGHATLGWAYFKQGRREEGVAGLRRAVELAPGNTQWLSQFGQILALAGHEEEARQVLRQLEDASTTGFVPPYHLAFVHTGLGEHERALDLLEEAFDERAGAIYGIKGSFLLEPLRDEPRFKALLAKMGLA